MRVADVPIRFPLYQNLLSPRAPHLNPGISAIACPSLRGSDAP